MTTLCIGRSTAVVLLLAVVSGNGPIVAADDPPKSAESGSARAKRLVEALAGSDQAKRSDAILA